MSDSPVLFHIGEEFPNAHDARWTRWAKILLYLQNMDGANDQFAPYKTDRTRRLIYKVVRSFGGTATNRDSERRLLLKLLNRLNLLAASKKAELPGLPHFGSGVTMGKWDRLAMTEVKALGQVSRMQAFTPSDPPAVDETAPTNRETKLQLERKILDRLNQIIT